MDARLGQIGSRRVRTESVAAAFIVGEPNPLARELVLQDPYPDRHRGVNNGGASRPVRTKHETPRQSLLVGCARRGRVKMLGL